MSPIIVPVLATAILLLVAALLWATVAFRTERRAAGTRVAELVRERGRIGAFIESAGEGLYTIDLEGRCTMANAAAAAWLGYAPEEMIGRSMHNLIHHTHADGRPYAEETCETARAFRGGMQVHVADDVFWRRDGTSFPVEYRSAPIIEEGTITGAVITFADVSQRARAAAVEHFLDESGRVLTSSLEFEETVQTLARLSVPIVADVCIIDIAEGDRLLDPVVAHVDDGAAEAIRAHRRDTPFDSTSDHPVMRAFRDCASVALEHAAYAVGGLGDTFARGATNPQASGARGFCIPLLARGRTLGVVTFARASRPFEHEDVALAHELARRASVAIDNARLYRDARAATTARDEVLAIVSHDLRNPVHTINLAAQLMLETLPEIPAVTPARKQAGVIRRAAQRANRLIADLLDVRRIETGRLAVERRPESMATILSDLLEVFSSDADERQIRLTTEISSPAPMVLADRERMLQLLTNLVGNAMKFTPRGGSVVARVESADGQVRCTIADSGPGIGADKLPHLFDRYWQADRTDRRGVGLGLSIAKGIADAHGGTLTAESIVGQGTTFTLTLPAAGTRARDHDVGTTGTLTAPREAANFTRSTEGL